MSNRWPYKKKPEIEPVVPFQKEVIVFAILLFSAAVVALTFICCNPVEAFNDKVGLEDDNIAEELIEFGIKEKTGIDLDLTPRSPECSK
jgi:hypothetical protein